MALKQRKAQPVFQRSNFTAYRTLRQAQLARRVRQIKTAGRNQKRVDRIQWGCRTRHNILSYAIFSWLL